MAVEWKITKRQANETNTKEKKTDKRMSHNKTDSRKESPKAKKI